MCIVNTARMDCIFLAHTSYFICASRLTNHICIFITPNTYTKTIGTDSARGIFFCSPYVPMHACA